MTKEFEIQCPEYVFSNELDLSSVGKHIDEVILENFIGKKVVIRGIQSGKHEISKKSMVQRIVQNGTDRTEDKDDNEVKVSDIKIDLFGFACMVEELPIVLPVLEGFHKWKPKSLERPQMKVDIWMIYDAKMLDNVEYTHSKYNVLAKDGYRFKEASNKNKALLAVISIQ